MTWYLVRTNLREFSIEAAGIGDALQKATQVCLEKIEWINSCEASAAPMLALAA